jgi:hypothetical protein
LTIPEIARRPEGLTILQGDRKDRIVNIVAA